MSKFLPHSLIGALCPHPEPNPKHPGRARPFIFQDAERFIVPGNPAGVVYDSVDDLYAVMRNRVPDGHEQIQDNPGATSSPGSIPYTDEYIIAPVPRDTWLFKGVSNDPALKAASYRDANDRGRIRQGGLDQSLIEGDYLNPNGGGANLGGFGENFIPGDDGQGGGGGGDIGGGGGGGGGGNPGGGDIGGGDDDDWGGGAGYGGLCPDGSNPIQHGGGLSACPVGGTGV